MTISKGLYNNTLILEMMTLKDDGQGGQIEEWEEAGWFKARISPLTSQERLSQNRVTSICSHHIYCDPMTVTTRDRIKWGDVYFQIVGIINPSEAYHHLELDVLEIV